MCGGGGGGAAGEAGGASGARLLAARGEATQKGCSRLELGGSQEDGVDQCYGELGADVVPMRRWVKAPRWFAWAFPRMWKVWTRPTRHR